MQKRTQPEPRKYLRRETAGRSLEALRDQYHSDLFDDYLPFWEEHGIDDELGGFMCTMDHDGSLLSTEKNIWHQKASASFSSMSASCQQPSSKLLPTHIIPYKEMVEPPILQTDI